MLNVSNLEHGYVWELHKMPFNSLWSSDAIWWHRSGITLAQVMAGCPNLLWSSEAIWWHRSGLTLAEVMACCLMASSHYLNQCLLIISEVLWSCGSFHRWCSRYLSFIWIWKITNYYYRHICQGPMSWFFYVRSRIFCGCEKKKNVGETKRMSITRFK